MGVKLPREIYILISLILSGFISNSLTPAHTYMIRKYVFGRGMYQDFWEHVLFFSNSMALPIVMIVTLIYGLIFLEFARRYNWKQITTYAIAGSGFFILLLPTAYNQHHLDRFYADSASIIFLIVCFVTIRAIAKNNALQFCLMLLVYFICFFVGSLFIDRGMHITMASLYGFYSSTLTWFFTNFLKPKLSEQANL